MHQTLRNSLRLLNHLKKNGLVRDYQGADEIREISSSISDEDLQDLVRISREQIANGEGYTTQQVRESLQKWRKST